MPRPRIRLCPRGHDKWAVGSGKNGCNECRVQKRRALAGCVDAPETPPHGTPCPVCNTIPKRRLDADHNHATGRFRGWLCGTCNKVLGSVNDDPERLRALARHLENA